jgi:hypothetical protein
MPDDAARPRFELLDPDEDITKRPGYGWLEVDHHLIDREDGLYAIVPVRCRFIGKQGNVADTPAVGLSVDSTEKFARNVLDHSQAAKLQARAVCGNEDATDLEQLAKQWDLEKINRTYGN